VLALMKYSYPGGATGVCALMLWVTAGLAAAPAAGGWYRGAETIMGTNIEVELWHDDAFKAREAVGAVMDEMHRVDRMMSPFLETSALAKLNREAAARPVRVPRELFDLVERSLTFSSLTQGAFDITFASVGYLYDFRQRIRPSNAQIQQLLGAMNFRHLVLDGSDRTIHFARAGVRIDLGGIAKGYAVDRSIALLRDLGVQRAIVTAGGDSRIMGDRLGRPWMIGVRDPRDAADMVAVLPARDEAISTSGDYERYFEQDGIRYHHIITPSSGTPAAGMRSVTVIGPDATTTDALSTSIFVLGATRGLALINALSGIEAVLVDGEGRLHYSTGLRGAARGKPVPENTARMH